MTVDRELALKKARRDLGLTEGEKVKDSGRRVKKRKATWEQTDSALEVLISQGKYDEAEQLADEMRRLRPYWQRIGVTKEEAIDDYMCQEVPLTFDCGPSSYALDENERIGVRYAEWGHAVEALAYYSAEGEEWNNEAALLRREMQAL